MGKLYVCCVHWLIIFACFQLTLFIEIGKSFLDIKKEIESWGNICDKISSFQGYNMVFFVIKYGIWNVEFYVILIKEFDIICFRFNFSMMKNSYRIDDKENCVRK